MRRGKESTHIIHRFSVFLFDAIARHSSEPGEEPVGERVHGVGRNQLRLLVDPSVASRGDKAKEIFNRREVERG